jgi:PAS domain S-box-containing protein
VDGPRQKPLALILAREFASTLAMPMFVADGDGNLVFYNEPAEEILGKSFAEVGEISAEEWTDLFRPQDLSGNPMPFSERPSGIALTERRPAHSEMQITRLDGQTRQVSVTALPLFAHEDEFVGALVVFWERV